VLARKAAQFVRRSLAHRRPFFVTPLPRWRHTTKACSRTIQGRRAIRVRLLATWVALQASRLPRPPSFNEANLEDKPQPRRRLRRGEIRQLTKLYRSRLESLLSVDDLVNKLVTVLRRKGALERTMIVFTSDNGYLLGEHRRVGEAVVMGSPFVCPS
jgi:arylsulfatase A-like enzyme